MPSSPTLAPLTPRSFPHLRADLRAIFLDGLMWSLMVGLAEWYLAAFALAVGKDEVIAGLITTVPLLLGAVLQMISPAVVRRLGSHRKWVVLCAVAQAVSLLPFGVAALAGHIPDALLFLLAALYWGSGMASGPAWTTWIGQIVPARVRTKFFARRSRFIQIGLLIGLVAGGGLLEYGKQSGRALPFFAVTFTLAAICRFISARLLAGQSEPLPLAEDHRRVPLRDWPARVRHDPAGRLLLYMFVIQFAAYVSGPFFGPFMFEQLRFSYRDYMILCAVQFIFKSVSFPLFGQLARRFSPRAVLWAGGLSLAPLAAFWTVSQNYGYLLVIQALAGIAWAAYELATFLLTFELIPEKERTSLLTTYALLNAVAIVGGSLLGGSILSAMGGVQEGKTVVPHTAYMVVFGLSSVVRFGALLLLRRVPGTRGETRAAAR